MAPFILYNRYNNEHVYGVSALLEVILLLLLRSLPPLRRPLPAPQGKVQGLQTAGLFHPKTHLGGELREEVLKRVQLPVFCGGFEGREDGDRAYPAVDRGGVRRLLAVLCGGRLEGGEEQVQSLQITGVLAAEARKTLQQTQELRVAGQLRAQFLLHAQLLQDLQLRDKTVQRVPDGAVRPRLPLPLHHPPQTQPQTPARPRHQELAHRFGSGCPQILTAVTSARHLHVRFGKR